MALRIARTIEFERFGIKAVYLIGSVKTATAGPCSDIDLLVHCEDDAEKHESLRWFCEGWGRCLSILNEDKTGYQVKGSLIDLHIITDQDIEKQTSFAVMLESIDNSARLLRGESTK